MSQIFGHLLVAGKYLALVGTGAFSVSASFDCVVLHYSFGASLLKLRKDPASGLTHSYYSKRRPRYIIRSFRRERRRFKCWQSERTFLYKQLSRTVITDCLHTIISSNTTKKTKEDEDDTCYYYYYLLYIQ